MTSAKGATAVTMMAKTMGLFRPFSCRRRDRTISAKEYRTSAIPDGQQSVSGNEQAHSEMLPTVEYTLHKDGDKGYFIYL